MRAHLWQQGLQELGPCRQRWLSLLAAVMIDSHAVADVMGMVRCLLVERCEPTGHQSSAGHPQVFNQTYISLTPISKPLQEHEPWADRLACPSRRLGSAVVSSLLQKYVGSKGRYMQNFARAGRVCSLLFDGPCRSVCNSAGPLSHQLSWCLPDNLQQS